MISKERLQELIKQEATIWVENQYCNAYDVELSNYNYIAITDDKESLMFLDYSIQEDDPESVLVDYLENLYETKEDAEFAREFKNITRTETLNLPTWEELNIIDEIKIYGENGKQYLVQADEYDISVYASDGYDFILYKRLKRTKGNYIKACTIARKLFLGESIEEGENDEESKN